LCEAWLEAVPARRTIMKKSFLLIAIIFNVLIPPVFALQYNIREPNTTLVCSGRDPSGVLLGFADAIQLDAIAPSEGLVQEATFLQVLALTPYRALAQSCGEDRVGAALTQALAMYLEAHTAAGPRH